MSYAVVVEDVAKVTNSRTILDSVSLRVTSGEVYGLLGPNGAGKTTLMNVVSGLLRLGRGRVLVHGEPRERPNVKKLIGYCPQDPGPIDGLSGLDNALFYGRLYGLSKREIVGRTVEYSEKLGLSRQDLAMKVGKYSGGMKKLSLVISLLHEPELLILDEPTTGMDPNARAEVWSLVLEFHARGGGNATTAGEGIQGLQELLRAPA